MELCGFEFVELASPSPNVLAPLFEMMGFSLVAKHRCRNVVPFRQVDTTSSPTANPRARPRTSPPSTAPRLRPRVPRQGFAPGLRACAVAWRYICENYGPNFHLPDLGPIGTNGLANPRDFLTPVAAYEDMQRAHQLIAKFMGQLWKAGMDHSPLDMGVWHGNYATSLFFTPESEGATLARR